MWDSIFLDTITCCIACIVIIIIGYFIHYRR